MKNPLRLSGLDEAMVISGVILAAAIAVLFSMVTSCSGWWVFISCKASLWLLFFWFSGFAYLCWAILGDGLQVSQKSVRDLQWPQPTQETNMESYTQKSAPVSPRFLALSLTSGFAATAFIASGLMLGDTNWPHVHLDWVMVGLYDLVLWATIWYVVWLERSGRSNARSPLGGLDYSAFVIVSLIMWAPTKERIEVFALGIIALAILCDTLHWAVVLHRARRW